MLATADRGFEALANPARRAIIQRLAKGPGTPGELAAGVPFSQPAFSQHLRVLRQAGLVEAHPSPSDARMREYRLSPGALDGVAKWIREVELFWTTQLHAFARYAEAKPPEDKVTASRKSSRRHQ